MINLDDVFVLTLLGTIQLLIAAAVIGRVAGLVMRLGAASRAYRLRLAAWAASAARD
jgi:hypothetical protein